MLLRILHDATADDGTPTTRLQGRPPRIKRPISGCKTPDAVSYIAKTVEYRKKKSKTKKR